jgi:peptidoglycan/LPS O-acetylase OafA/YrhL
MSTTVALAVTGEPHPTTPVKPVTRFAFIDGLRGLAALGIAGYHIWRYEPTPYPADNVVPDVIKEVLLRSWIGVQFLWVVSGFVIAYTLRDTWITPREALSFLGRRIVRLVPPYWFTIFLVVLVSAVGASWWGLPSPFEDSLTVGPLVQLAEVAHRARLICCRLKPG